MCGGAGGGEEEVLLLLDDIFEEAIDLSSLKTIAEGIEEFQGWRDSQIGGG